MKYMWAAYRLGSFDEVVLPKGLKIDEFEERVLELLTPFSQILTVVSDQRPVGMFLLKERQWIVEPHAEWFPWATSRQIVEASIKLLDDIRRTPYEGFGPDFKEAFIVIPRKFVKFMTHIAKYGIVKRIGTSAVLGYDGERALFETRRSNI